MTSSRTSVLRNVIQSPNSVGGVGWESGGYGELTMYNTIYNYIYNTDKR